MDGLRDPCRSWSRPPISGIDDPLLVHYSSRGDQGGAEPQVGGIGTERRMLPEGLAQRDRIPGAGQRAYTGRRRQPVGQPGLNQRHAFGSSDEEGNRQRADAARLRSFPLRIGITVVVAFCGEGIQR